MPNSYTEKTTNSPKSYSSVPTQNLPQTWTGAGNGAQIQMYNVHDFKAQQQTAQIAATHTTTQPNLMNWLSSDSPDPWSWGASDPNQWPIETDQHVVSTHGNMDGTNTGQHAGVFGPQTFFNQDSSSTPQTWQNESYFHSFQSNVNQQQLPLQLQQFSQQQQQQPQFPPQQQQHQQQLQFPPQQQQQLPLTQHHQQLPPPQQHQQLPVEEIKNPELQQNHIISWSNISSFSTFRLVANLLTINDSLSASQDTLDASHFMPAETVEEIRKHVAEMEIKDMEDTDTNATNQEIPVEIPTEPDDDKIRQPPEGAANKSPVGMIAIPPTGKAMPRPSAGTPSVIPTSTATTTPQADPTNDETLRPDDTTTYRFNVQPGFSPREDSPFKPPPKSASCIPVVIQQERLPEESLLQQDDDGANLEMMPDNSEQLPTDIGVPLPETKVSESPSVPASASLWNDSDVKQQTIFLAPPSTASPMQTQNVLIIPSMEQKEPQNSPLTALRSQGGVHENIENVSQIVDASKAKVEKLLEMPTETKDSVEYASKPPEDLKTDNRGQRPPIPGLGPVQVPRSTSELPRKDEEVIKSVLDRECAPKKAETPNRRGREDDKFDNHRRLSNEGVENQKGRGPIANPPDPRQQREFGNDRRSYYPQRPDSRQDRDYFNRSDSTQSQEYVDERFDDRKRDYLDDRRRNVSEHMDRRRDYGAYPEDRAPYPDDSRSFKGRRYEYDDRSRQYADPYYVDRDRSRPSSRPSMEDDREHERVRRGPDDRPPSRGVYDDRDYYERGRRGLDERPSSRGGYESDRENSWANLPRDDYYRKDPRYYRDTAYMSERDRYYQQYYNYYNNYNYGYYDEMYRTDPRYREQYEAQYRNYYAHYGGYESSSDQRSIQSGRSSVNDDIQREREKIEVQGNNNLNQGYLDCSQTNESYYPDSFSKSLEDTTPSVRLTPAKFMRPHIKVQLTANGHLVKVLANSPNDGQPASVEINSNNAELEELKKFPGPLVKGETHKNDIIQFCNEKIKSAKKDMELTDKSSYILIWELLILLVRQNGTVVGTDIAELLMKDAQKAESPTEMASAETSSNSELATPDEGIVVLDRSVISHFSEEMVTKKFRECLLSGRKKEALEKAMKNGLWGHALFLASKMDTRTYANVMTRFANSLALNDPLQTLYQLMSGRQPAAVTCIAEEKWGDWRPHLAMILSNPTQKPNLDRKSIMAMGDTLATRGLLHASQFCYLMAQMDFGTYASKSSKLVLLTANQGLPFGQFATNEAIQCTEVYEFAQQLASLNFIIPTFQSYRFIYATRLVEFGMPQECLRYCEVLSETISQFPSIFHSDLVAQIYELANKLKFYDQSYNESDDLSDPCDPAWLIKLRNILNGTSEDIQQAPEEIPYYASESSNASENGEQQQQIYSNSFPQSSTNTSYYDPSMPAVDLASSYPGYQPNQQQPHVPQIISNEPTQFSYTDPTRGYQHDYSQTTGDVYSGGLYYPTDQNSFIRDNNTYQPTDISTSADYWDISTKKASPPLSPNKPTADANAAQSKNIKAKSKQEPKHKPLSGSGGNSGSSWLGGIFSKLMPKPKNQMKLPDDRNPSIIWDPVAKKWMNTEADEDEIISSGPVAPPKDMPDRKQSIPGQNEMSSLNSSLINSNSLPPPSMGRTQKRYVDVVGSDTKFKAQTSNLPSQLFEQPSSNQTPQMFIPQPVTNNNSAGAQSEFAEYSPQVAATGHLSQPHLEDDGDLSRSSSQGSLGREVQHYMASQIQMTEAPVPPPVVQQPLLFNPNLVPVSTTIAPLRGPRRPNLKYLFKV
uniref:Protein transport protein sec16 n=1 Tax=Strigamia maritima TaxID=126957 RepID=T1J191_STRMM